MSSYHEYVNLDITNNSTNPVPLQFSQNRDIPFLKDCKDYFCSIVRASLQTGNTLPVFIPDIMTGQSDPNQTVYNITFKFNAIGNGLTRIYTRSAYITFTSNDQTQPTPAAPLVAQDLSSSYYYLYNINDFS